MDKHEEAIEAALTIKEYCTTKPLDCEGCVFNSNKCILNDPNHLPETWQIKRKVKT